MRLATSFMWLAVVLVSCGRSSPDEQWRNFQQNPQAYENTGVTWRVIYEDRASQGSTFDQSVDEPRVAWMSLTYLEAEPGQYGVPFTAGVNSANGRQQSAGPLANPKRPVHIDGGPGYGSDSQAAWHYGKYRESQAAWQGVDDLSTGDYLEVTGKFVEVDPYDAPMIIPTRIVRLEPAKG